MRVPRVRFTVRGIMVLAALAALPALFVRLTVNAREAARNAQCRGNMTQITLALHNYHSVHGCWPPAYLADAAGKPMHSWRVLILPWMEQSTLFNLYNFAVPWDGLNNRRLIGMMPYGYACPSHRVSASGFTDYFVLFGPETVFPGARSTRLTDVKDDPSETLLLVEASNLAVPWTEPRDLDTSTM